MRPIGFVTSARRVTWRLMAGLILVACGCRNEVDQNTQQAQAPTVARPVRAIVVDDVPLGEALERQWTARTKTPLQLQHMSSDELEGAKQLAGDIVVYPSSCLGVLAQRRLIAPPSMSVLQTGDYSLLDVFDVQRNSEVRWGAQIMAVSFGSPQLVLLYRQDLFREFQLEPPDTWEHYGELVQKLGREELGDLAPEEGKAWFPVCEPLAAGWAGTVLLARAAAYAAHPSQFSVLFDYTNMAPLIAGPPFVRALEELLAATRRGPADMDQDTPETARRRLLSGEVAMVLSWPARAPQGSASPPLPEGVEIGCAELPGAREAYDFAEKAWTPHAEKAAARVPLIAVAGRLGSVTSNARRPREAAEMLALLTSTEWSDVLSPASAATTLFRKSHLKKPSLWTDPGLPPEASQQYAALVESTQARPIYTSGVRMAGWKRYMQALDQAVQAARSGQSSAQDALTEAAAKWSAITSELGVESQLDAYTRSLGLEP